MPEVLRGITKYQAREDWSNAVLSYQFSTLYSDGTQDIQITEARTKWKGLYTHYLNSHAIKHNRLLFVSKVSIFIGSAETILGRCAETHYGNEWGVGGTHKSGQEYEYQPPGPRLSEHPSAHLDNICNLV